MRPSLIAPADLTDEQRPLYDDTRAGIERGFATQLGDGALLGPWNPWLHEPRIGRAVWELTKAPSSVSVLPEPCRQVAILVTGAHFRAGYEIYAHLAVAQKDGISDEAISTIVAGQRPSDLPHDQAVACDVAAALTGGGVLPALTRKLAEDAFDHGVAELVHSLGLDCMVSVTLNGFDVPVPEPGSKG